MSEKIERPSVLARLQERQGRMIREEREARGWSQQDLADAAQTNQQTVDRIERGVTVKSKALPAILAVLNLEKGFSSSVIEDAIESMRRTVTTGPSALPKDAPIGAVIESWRKHHEDRIPVYAVSHPDQLVLVSSVPPMYPVELVNGAFGFVTHRSDMVPALRRGEIAITNPHLPLEENCEVLVIRNSGNPDVHDIVARTLVRIEDDYWVLATWNPPEEIKLSKAEYRVLMIVAKISKYR